MRLGELVAASARVAGTSSRLEKIAHLAEVIRRLPAHEVAVGVSVLMGEIPQGRIGVGYATLQTLQGSGRPPAAGESSLEIAEVDAIFGALKGETGTGMAARRAASLGTLLARATVDEQAFLVRLLIGELRQGALEGVLVDAVARAFDTPAAPVRRATMLAGGLAPVAAALAREGVPGLSAFDLTLFRPLQPMLADTADDVEGALGRLGEAAFEYKLDGARVQVHKDGERVEVYSRLLNAVTPAVPEIIERVRALPAGRLILDGEALVRGSDGRPSSFQTTMRRFGRRIDVEALRTSLPLDVSFFDVLRVDDQVLLDTPLTERWAALQTVAGAENTVARLVTADGAAAGTFLRGALAAGYEGLVAKNLTAGYAAGRRGQDWLKLKAAHTFDLVVLAAEWGNGRRRGWLSNLHLGARDPDNGGFVMLGKTFKGMTDEILRWQTEALQARAIGDEGIAVHVRPELVVEIAFNDVQRSPHYPGGVALRFARLKRYRPDKRADQASTIAEVRALLPSDG
jgi:DNA ligase 1